MKVGYIDTQREARDLRIVPIDGKGDGSIAQDAEVEGIVRVFPDVVAAEDQILSESLLQAGMEFVAKARLQRARNPGRASKQRRQHRIGATLAGEHKIFVERRLQGARIGDAQHGVGPLDVVGKTQREARPERALARPLYKSPRMPRLKSQLPALIDLRYREPVP